MAAKLTYKSLYQQVREEIGKSKVYNTSTRYSDQLSRISLIPSSAFGANDNNTAQIITAIQKFLTNAVPSFIKTGLTVSAKDPNSSTVTVSAGSGAAAGYYYELDGDVDVTVPFNATNEVFYINLYLDRILVEQTKSDNKLTVAKIVVPYPGVTNVVRDTKDDSYDAYIVNFKTYNLYGDANGNFEEDTVELLRANIGAILADNLIGNIRLNEDLKITNTQGSLELNSSEMKLLSTSGTTLAKFNKNGSFYYNSDGIEIARFTTTDAKIGNILITENSIQSADYISESRGFKIQDSGFAEFQDVRIRGRISSSIFETDKISAVGGKLYISNASNLSANMTALDSSTLTVDDSVFSVGDILVIKNGINEEYMQVTNISSAPTYVVTRDLASAFTANNNPTWSKGTAIVSTGNPNSGQNPGFILLDAVSQFSPFIDIAERVDETPTGYNVRLRLGNLEGISDDNFNASGGSLSGYGLYADNVYLKGSLAASTICSSDLYSNNIYSSTVCSSCLIGSNCIVGAVIKTSETGQRLMMDDTGLYAYDSTGNLIARFRGDGIRFIDPNCDACYSYLDSGALKFHHPYGDIPYAKQIKSGTATVGTTVCLSQWYCQPELMIGISSMKSYDSGYPSDCQQFCVYYDNLQQYDNSGGDFGWSFDVHGTLSLSGGTIGEQIYNYDFATSLTTCANVCSAVIKMNFQLFTNSTAPSTLCYGCLCYHLRWRPFVSGGGGLWTCCNLTYSQPHATCTEMQTTQTVCHTIAFGSSDDWEVEAIQDGITWFDSGISSGTTIQNCCCMTLACCAWACGCANASTSSTCQITCNFCLDFGVSPFNPSDVFCSLVCYQIGGSVQPFVGGQNFYPNYARGYGNDGNVGNGGFHCEVCLHNNGLGTCTCCINLPTSVIFNPTLAYLRYICFEFNACSTNASAGGADYGFFSCGCLYNICQIICYYSYSGGAASCCLRKLYSTLETTTDATILDGAGTVNWLAVAYA